MITLKINPPSGLVAWPTTCTDLRFSIEPGLIDKFNKEITMVDREEKKRKKLEEAKQVYDQWQEASKAHWSHWRAWGSWFSWGSPVGLGLFFVLLALAFSIVVWIIKF